MRQLARSPLRLVVLGGALLSIAASGPGVNAALLAVIALVLVAAKLLGDVAERLGLPAVLGEILVGVLLGNLDLIGAPGLEPLLRDPQLALLGELGVIVLLFQVGLESNLGQMARVGGTAFAVACVGVVVPMGLGYGVHALLAPDRTWHTHLFIGAVLAATSVGITARVFKDLGRIDSPTGRVVLGAAVIDDVLGLIVLAVVSGLVAGAERGEAIDVLAVLLIVGKAVGFLGGAIVLGGPVSRRLYRAAARLRVRGVLLAASLGFCLALSYLAHLVGLAPIVGAFAAGLVLDELSLAPMASPTPVRLEHELRPLAEVLTPMFFVLTGATVDLGALGNGHALALAGALTAAAVVGKQACALVPAGPGVHRLSVGIGMIPRGEVGLIFADKGAQLVLAGQAVISPDTFAAVVLMVMVTTLATPPLLAWSLRRAPADPAR